MVGVPTGRGCDACRGQRKKCIGNTAPCARCERLKIPCIGFGELRYKFVDRTCRPKRREKQVPVTSVQELAHDLDWTSEAVVPYDPPRGNTTAICLFRPLSNALTSLTSIFIGSISPSTQIKYHLPFNFGGFLREIPARLGCNEALDAASDALMTAYSRFCNGNTTPAGPMLIKYGIAIQALRTCLEDPIKAHSPETLAAILVIIIYQALSGESVPMGHSTGVVKILKNRGYAGPTNHFEKMVLGCLRGPIMIEAFTNPAIDLTDQEWEDLVVGTAGLNPDLDESVIQCLGQAPRLLGRVRNARRQPTEFAQQLPGFIAEATQLHQTIKWALNGQQQRLANLDGPRPGLYHAHYTRQYVMGLSVGITVSHLYAALIGDVDGSLGEEVAHYAREVIRLAEVSRPYRPLGALCVIISASIVWVCVVDPELRQQAYEIFKDFGTDLMLNDRSETDSILVSAAQNFWFDGNMWGGWRSRTVQDL